MSNEITKTKKFEISETGLKFLQRVSYEEWEHIGKGLSLFHKAIHWITGDWLRFGSENYPEKWSQAIDITGFSYHTLQNDAWVASRIPPSRRRKNLSWGIHAELAKLEPAEQEIWFKKIEDENLTIADVRARLHQSGGELISIEIKKLNHQNHARRFKIRDILYERLLLKLEKLNEE